MSTPRKRKHGMNHFTYFNTKNPIVDELINEFEVGEFVLTDNRFVQACEEYGLTEDHVMELMINCDKGEFVRIDRGWLFIENNPRS